MGDKTKIDWADATWNPVTGCLHGCEYCYARKIAERFGGSWHGVGKCHVLDEREIKCAVFDEPIEYPGKVNPYPYSFDPTFHRYKLDDGA